MKETTTQIVRSSNSVVRGEKAKEKSTRVPRALQRPPQQR